MERNYPEKDTAKSAEVFEFTTDESELSINSISYFVMASLNTLDYNRDIQSYDSMIDTTEENVSKVASAINYLQSGDALINKFASHFNETATNMSLTPEELQLLGEALYYYGVVGYSHAMVAVEEKISFQIEEHKLKSIEEINKRRDAIYALYKNIEPRVDRSTVEWWYHWPVPDMRGIELGK